VLDDQLNDTHDDRIRIDGLIAVRPDFTAGGLGELGPGEFNSWRSVNTTPDENCNFQDYRHRYEVRSDIAFTADGLREG
jgi:hypothetical protein